MVVFKNRILSLGQKDGKYTNPETINIDHMISFTFYTKTDISVTLTSVGGYEYTVLDDGAGFGSETWQDSNVFNGLTPNTAYDFYQRIKETTTHFASSTVGINAILIHLLSYK